MPHYDLPLAELEAFRPDIREPADFDEFWERTIAEARTAGGEVVLEAVDNPLPHIDVFDVTFPGYGGQPVKGWLLRPAGVQGDLPAIVHYAGYGGGRSLAIEHTFWATAGYAYFVMDTRGQGSAWGNGGATADPEGSGPSHPGFMTRGIESPETYYYRRVFTDGVRAVDAVRTMPGIDSSRVAIHGGSQGGAITLAVSALVPDVQAACMDVAFLCHFERAIALTDDNPFGEIQKFLRTHRDRAEQVLTTLSYFDGVNFAKRAHAPSLWSVALMDTIVPPSTTFAAFNWYGDRAGQGVGKAMEVYPYNGHEGGEWRQIEKQRAFLDGLLS
ncbi:acetylxylan esterase [Demequina oxidasica]|uniref:acetylxylan esterase n=1 Tax=Demequina oxidasica TaxID=676199 RepID=UPI0007863CD4|nr:acetylxylan esterase [Demequina oxidasica]